MDGPLKGIKVVDFSRVLAGPLAARTLGDLGAEIIKIEPPRPDVSRFSFPFKPGMSGYYAQQNSGKRNLSIDLNVPGALEIVLRLCDGADVVIENFRAGTLASFGLDYATLSRRNPRLVYVSITGYGQAGPWASRMAYAPTVQAETGFTSNTVRHFELSPETAQTDPLSHADVYSGLQAAVGALAALRSRDVTGQGQHVDVAMAAVMLAVNERAHIDLEEIDTGAEPAVLGATDGPFFVGPGGEQFIAAQSLVGSFTFINYLKAMRRADLARDPRFATAALRRDNFAALHAIVQQWICSFRDFVALDAQFDESKIAIGQVRTIKELGQTEWATYWGAYHDVPDRHGGHYRLHGRPWKFNRDGLADPGIPAFRGEHNAEVCHEIGYSAEQVEQFIAKGILLRDGASP